MIAPIAILIVLLLRSVHDEHGAAAGPRRVHDGWLRVNTLELNALRSHAIVTVAAVRWSDVLTGCTGRLLVELTAEFSLSSEDLPSLLSFAGVIVPGEAEFTIPLAERFFNGGENTVRSFKESELGLVGMAF